MRRPLTLNAHPSHNQQGFALFIVLMIMIVIALLVVAASQAYSTEQRISSNDSDRKFALTLAEAALREGENHILDFEDQTITFTEKCDNGYCAAVGVKSPASNPNIIVSGSASKNPWERSCGHSKKTCLEEKGRKYSIKGAREQPRYIIEFIKIDSKSGATIYRVTAKAWGKNPFTSVITQSYIADE